ncbi:MAG: hypothetical protein M3Q58_10075 [Bacteroidota bacterium]|nr:hypothetical protein [Bacteroidota bacterium]
MKRFSIISLLIITLFTVASCRKDNRRAKQLDGEWKVKSIQWDGKVLAIKTDLFEFTKCKVTKENCQGLLTATDGSKESFEWQIYSKGEEFAIIYNNTAVSDTTKIQCIYEYNDFNWELPCNLKNAQVECLYFSGNYTIDTWEDDLFVISSTNCTGCYDKSLVVILERK